jgi:hypothetical protein
MRIVAYCPLHYGLPYLEWAIRSIIPQVDAMHILYSPHGSHNGNPGTMPCPDSEGDLLETARAAAGDKLVWHRGDWQFEGQQRDTIFQIEPDADVILALDYDEIWPTLLVDEAIRFALQGTARRIRVPIMHYYKSFWRAVTDDAAYPIRLIVPKAPDIEATLETNRRINHMGYAIPMVYMRYKWHGIHGHQAELKPNWVEGVYADSARLVDVHPVGTHWNPKRVDPFENLPHYMVQHPYYFKATIE